MAELVIREYYDAESLAYQRLGAAAFHTPNPALTDPEKALADVREKEARHRREAVGDVPYRRIGGFLDGRLAASMDVSPYLVNFDGHTVLLGGVGSVCSEPELRRGGAVRKVFSALFEAMHRDGYVLSHLDPFTANFYRKFGYEAACQQVFWVIPTEYLPAYSNSGIVRYEGTEQQKADVHKVWSAWTRGVNLTQVRSDYRWEKWEKEHEPYASEWYGYLHYNAAGEPDGFLCYKTVFDGPQPMAVDCETGAFWYDGPDGLYALLQFAAGMKDYARELRLCLPASEDLSYMVEITGGWGKKLISRRVVNNGTTRIVDVKRALELCRCKGKGTVCIQVEDPGCLWNNGAFTLRFGEGENVVTPGGEPDITLSILAFSALILGRGGLQQALYHPGTCIHGNASALEQVFYPKTVFSQEHY